MDFYAVLERVLEILQQHKRVTYRALQRQFDLDEAYLEDLKAEIIEAQRLAVDENGTVLVWTGGADPAPPSMPAQPEPLRDTQADQTAQVTPVPVLPRPTDAERRQLTVMFCDLVDSTALSRCPFRKSLVSFLLDKGRNLRACSRDVHTYFPHPPSGERPCPCLLQVH